MSHLTGLATGYHELDDLTSGLQGGEMIIIAARPSMGKTALALNIAEYVTADENKPLAFFSMEMSRQQIAQRMLCTRARINSQRLAGEGIGGTVYVFLDDPELLVDGQVEFFMDGFGPLVTDNFAKWDFKGTTGIGPTDLANPWDTSSDPFATNGSHRITARALLNDGSTVNVTADFTVSN